MREMISADEALDIILNNTTLLAREKVFIIDALNRVIAEDIYSSYNIPLHDNSAMDGFAIKSSDTKGASKDKPVKLKIIATLPAGKVFDGSLKSGEAIKIMTGAVVPEGADCIAKKEICKEKDGYVYIFEEVPIEKDLRKSGEDIKEGELVIEKGTVINPAVIGVLASLGKSSVYVYKRPLVSILISGDEIVDIDEPLTKGKVKNSNTYSLISLIKEFGGVPINCGIVKDDKDSMYNTIKENLNADIILSTGGVSVGDYDFTKEVIMELGFTVHFWRIRLKPGKPLLFATLGNKLYFGIPGNPVSAMVIFYNFILPAMLKMQGFKKIFLPETEAILVSDIKRKDTRKECIRGILYEDNGNLYVKTTGPQGSGILKSMLKGNCFIVINENVGKVKKGDKVKVLVYDKFYWYK